MSVCPVAAAMCRGVKPSFLAILMRFGCHFINSSTPLDWWRQKRRYEVLAGENVSTYTCIEVFILHAPAIFEVFSMIGWSVPPPTCLQKVRKVYAFFAQHYILQL